MEVLGIRNRENKCTKFAEQIHSHPHPHKNQSINRAADDLSRRQNYLGPSAVTFCFSAQEAKEEIGSLSSNPYSIPISVTAVYFLRGIARAMRETQLLSL